MLPNLNKGKELNSQSLKYRFIFACGGTGGHLFPAIAVADCIKKKIPDAEILFVGTKKKLESTYVPKSGYSFKSIWISGFSRKLSLKNILIPLKVIFSILQSLLISLRFKPSVAIGTGAYVAGPMIWSAYMFGSKIILLEANSYPGLTNRLLQRKADEIHVTFEDSKKYFTKSEKVYLSGNPIRFSGTIIDKPSAVQKLGLNASLFTILIIGGSLGAKAINEAVAKNLDRILQLRVQLIWQTGKNYYELYKNYQTSRIKVLPFIDDMATAYSAADLLIARAGASTVTEAAFWGKAVIFIPSDNVTDDHQYKNAKTLLDNNAAELIRDSEAVSMLYYKILELMNNKEQLNSFAINIKKFSKPNAAEVIADSAIRLAEGRV